jgi:hypothetical protein
VHILQSYCESLGKGDADKISSLFTEDATFYDGAFEAVGKEPVSLKGRDAIQAFFREAFKQLTPKVTNIGVNGVAVRYDVDVGEAVIFALGVMEEENGLIKEYIITAV